MVPTANKRYSVSVPSRALTGECVALTGADMATALTLREMPAIATATLTGRNYLSTGHRTCIMPHHLH